MLRHTTKLVLLMAAVALTSTVFGQARRERETAPAADQQADPQLIRILEIWSQESKKVRKLKGEVRRRELDSVFSVERFGHGVFDHEAPDKGRLDMVPVEITEKQIQARNQPGAKVRRDANGKPFKLEIAMNECWICDGQSVININDDKKEASIAELPESMRGEQIMNTPLPFLFGLPPDEALRRFDLELVKVLEGKVRLKAIPRLRQDGQSWKEAEVYLDTKTWLPTAVKLTDPAGTKQTVYEFSEMKANAFDVIWWKDPFRVSLKGYKVEIIRADGNQQDIAAGGNQEAPVLPNLVGLPYTNAIAKLKTMGFTDDEIAKLRGGKAQDAADQLRIRARIQLPERR